MLCITPHGLWISSLVNRRNKNVAAVAVANKNVRIMWALLAHDRDYRKDYKRDVAPV
jgi:transposase